jgi:hypothetical protein
MTHKRVVFSAFSAVSLCLLTGCQAPLTTSSTPTSDDEYMQQEIDSAWQSYLDVWGTADERPTVAIERIIEQDEWAPVMAECLSGEGFADVVTAPDGTFSYDGPASQTQAYDRAVYVCTARFPINGKYYRPLSSAQLTKLYAFYVDEQTACLEENGYSVGDPPSLAQFLETVGTPRGWAPYSSVSYSTQSEWERINAACPQTPGTNLYDDAQP